MSVAKLKAAARRRDGFCCVKCGMTNDAHRERYGKQLDVHRVVPGSAYTLDGCVTRCRACHMKEPKRPAGTYPGARPGFGAKYIELPADVVAAVKSLAATYGTTFVTEVADALRRHVAYPPRREPEPLPDAAQPAPRKGRGKK